MNVGENKTPQFDVAHNDTVTMAMGDSIQRLQE
jgi:hypothetical protein